MLKKIEAPAELAGAFVLRFLALPGNVTGKERK